jgi:hypothetical protein
LTEECGGIDHVRYGGTDNEVFNGILWSIPGVKVEKISYKADLMEIDEHLDKGGIIAVNHLYKKEEYGHYCLVVARTEKAYVLVNEHTNKIYSRVPRKRLHNLLQLDRFNFGTYNCSVAWFITKARNSKDGK